MSGIGSLGAAGAESKDKRKMTQGILEDASKDKKDTYAFLEDDDEFEEFEDEEGDRAAGFHVPSLAAGTSEKK